MGEILNSRRTISADRLTEFSKKVPNAARHCVDAACVYVTGSFARGEASAHSDMDLFIVGEGTHDEKNRGLSKLDEIIVKADLIAATREMRLPEFSGGGEYLVHHTIGELVHWMGTPKDDYLNSFTARLLLLLESKPLLGESAYQHFIDEVITAYWRDYAKFKDNFVPAFLANDILRMWRTFCVNYEARTRRDPPEARAKRKLKNYKLKHSRLLTCYSALLYLLDVFNERATVTPDDARHMVSLSPTQRIEWLLGRESTRAAHVALQRVIGLYENFLESTDASEAELIEGILTKSRRFSSPNEFGDTIYEAANRIGNSSRLQRLLVV